MECAERPASTGRSDGRGAARAGRRDSVDKANVDYMTALASCWKPRVAVRVGQEHPVLSSSDYT
jgi:hypothetical protein